MRQTQFFTKTRREVPKDEEAKNAELLIRGGFINKEMAGVYSLLPLGLRVVNKIKKIVAEEIEKLGSMEILMSTLQNKEVWEQTNRWDDEKVDVWFKSKLKSGAEVGLGWSHEESITEMVKSHISSYKNLPVKVHQFQNKLRNEVRAKSGIIRCREFIMKDMYYFATTEEENNDFYNKTIEAYKNIFKKIGLGDKTFVTSASGGIFTDKFSHEFQTICEAGEDTIYINKSKDLALNEEIFNKNTLDEMGLVETDFEKTKTAEVGNIFNFGTKKCEEMGLYFTNKEGEKKPVYLSSYGIGITRLMGVVVEIFSEENSLVWPKNISPFDLHLLRLGESDEVKKKTEEIYQKLSEKTEVLYDDREARAGEKFADADLIGIPKQIIISEKGLEKGILELKDRKNKEIKEINIVEIDSLTVNI